VQGTPFPSPAQLCLDRETVTGHQRRQGQSELKSVLGHRLEEAVGAVDVQAIAGVLGQKLDAIEQTEKLELVEEVAIVGGGSTPHRGAHTQRTQQDRLVLGEVVLGQQGLRRKQARLAENVGVG